MSFWSSEKLKIKQQAHQIIHPFEDNAVKHAAYELALGQEAFLTSFPEGVKKTFSRAKPIKIPPGQFGLLITNEVVKIPNDSIGFISIRAKIKFRGLVNISGFHVDPGFEGKLKFSVYNAGSQAIVVTPGDRIFMIWFADLDRVTQDGYGGSRTGVNEITSQNIMDLQGHVDSPSALRESLNDLERKFTIMRNSLLLVVSAIVAAAASHYFPILMKELSTSPNKTSIAAPTSSISPKGKSTR